MEGTEDGGWRGEGFLVVVEMASQHISSWMEKKNNPLPGANTGCPDSS